MTFCGFGKKKMRSLHFFVRNFPAHLLHISSWRFTKGRPAPLPPAVLRSSKGGPGHPYSSRGRRRPITPLTAKPPKRPARVSRESRRQRASVARCRGGSARRAAAAWGGGTGGRPEVLKSRNPEGLLFLGRVHAPPPPKKDPFGGFGREGRAGMEMTARLYFGCVKGPWSHSFPPTPGEGRRRHFHCSKN